MARLRVLALDIATNLGVAVDMASRTDRPLLFSINLGRDDGYLGRTFAVYGRRLTEIVKKFAPDVIAYEAALEQKRGEKAINSLTVSQKLLGLVAITQMVGYQRELRISPCNIQQVRRDFVGNGRADKDAIFDQCKVLGWHPRDFDQSDAAAVWSYMHGYLKQRDIVARSR